jgi:hypothetical protein
MDDQERLLNAKRRVVRLKGFYIHAAIFVLVMLGLLGLNIWLAGPYWVAWVFLGWGLGLAGHALAVFGPRLTFASDWEARKVKELMDRQPKP